MVHCGGGCSARGRCRNARSGLRRDPRSGHRSKIVNIVSAVTSLCCCLVSRPSVRRGHSFSLFLVRLNLVEEGHVDSNACRNLSLDPLEESLDAGFACITSTQKADKTYIDIVLRRVEFTNKVMQSQCVIHQSYDFTF